MSVVSVFMESRSHKQRAFKFAESIVACSRVCVCELSHFRAQSVTKQPNFSYIWHFLLHLSGKTKGRSKKWRELLKFPHHTISAHLKNESKLSLAFPWSLLSLVFSLAVPLSTESIGFVWTAFQFVGLTFCIFSTHSSAHLWQDLCTRAHWKGIVPTVLLWQRETSASHWLSRRSGKERESSPGDYLVCYVRTLFRNLRTLTIIPRKLP